MSVLLGVVLSRGATQADAGHEDRHERNEPPGRNVVGQKHTGGREREKDRHRDGPVVADHEAIEGTPNAQSRRNDGLQSMSLATSSRWPSPALRRESGGARG